MKNKVYVLHYDLVSYFGECRVCSFFVGIDGREFPAAAVRSAIRKHVADTGHKVVPIKGSEAHYLADDSTQVLQ